MAGDAIEDGFSTGREEAESYGKLGVHGRREACTFVQQSSCAVDESFGHGLKLGGEHAAFDLAFYNTEALHVLGRDIATRDP